MERTPKNAVEIRIGRVGIATLASLLSVFWCCQNENRPTFPENPVITEIPVRSVEGGMPNLFVAENNRVFLSWIEYLNDTTDALCYATLEDDRWSEPHIIASASNWFVNWADFPSIAVFSGAENALAAHWLQMRAAGTYDYDIHIALSTDGGQSWSPSFVPHRDSLAAEHGFVSLVPLLGDRMFATWLDGRNTKTGGNTSGDHGHGQGGPMSLRSAVFDTQGRLQDEIELDDMVCDCCQTDATLTTNGIVVVYRDRTENEVRDISIVRQVEGIWTTPEPVHHDDWKIAGCPVNGPAIASYGDTLAVAWFTIADSIPSVYMAFSFDGGETFAKPVRIDEGKPLGRVDIVMLSREEALVSWMEADEDNAHVLAARVGVQGKSGKSIIITSTTASRQSGFPVMEKRGDDIVFAWTEIDSVTVVKTAILAHDLE